MKSIEFYRNSDNELVAVFKEDGMAVDVEFKTKSTFSEYGIGEAVVEYLFEQGE